VKIGTQKLKKRSDWRISEADHSTEGNGRRRRKTTVLEVARSEMTMFYNLFE
jgi:hypothetical protein